MTKKTKKRACDFTLLLVTLLLVIIGITMVFSSSWPESIKEMGNGFYFLKKQAISAIIGLIALLFFMNFNYKNLKKLSLLIFIFSIATGLLIFTPLAKTVKGATRWIDLKPIISLPITFMPSDIIKLGSIIFLASFLSKRKRTLRKFKSGLIPVVFIIGLSCGMILLQKDVSTTATLAMTLMTMFFVAGMKLSHMFLLGGLGAGALFLAITDESNLYRMKRLTNFRNPFEDPLGSGYQVVQSLYALGSGGLFGLGLGKSRQKFFYIPEAHNDFIFAIIGEELGFIGVLIVIALFIVLIWRGIQIALNIDDLFGSLLATGIVTLITIQSLIHIAVVTSLMPPTGITLPFLSYGGTSLILYMSAVGILLNISRHINPNRS